MLYDDTDLHLRHLSNPRTGGVAPSRREVLLDQYRARRAAQVRLCRRAASTARRRRLRAVIARAVAWIRHALSARRRGPARR
ncbi:hypothetical protein OEZ60_08175 [Defluviimonas sp. WL0024]|uniref:Uncharacterized protein n=1 Tax=Albidovulum salinarum TaxID=2984153 RepID=A0ABT2X210_9RHOB|nr:hypothetical protein [Defluviimonas sp. WL0024]MCU9847981.1 hypothetical protein [Defluviimonas sp. WL0024]